jgi:hypothetical protein
MRDVVVQMGVSVDGIVAGASDYKLPDVDDASHAGDYGDSTMDCSGEPVSVWPFPDRQLDLPGNYCCEIHFRASTPC